MSGVPAAVAVGELKGIGPRKAAALAASGIETVGDLLCRLPRSYQDRSAATPIGELKPGQDAVVSGRVLGLKLGRRGRSLEIAVEDGTGSVLATWFRPRPWMKAAFAVGDAVVLMGRLDARARPLRFAHPEVERPEQQSVHRGGVVPLYDPPQGFGQRSFRALVHQALEAFPDRIADPVPPAVRARAALPARSDALRLLHFPEGNADVPALRAGTHIAHEALLFEDLFVLQVALAVRRARLRRDGAQASSPSELARRVRASLPFQLTVGQEDALAAIRGDLAGDRPMLRLLQGDVGAGKTLVALLAACDVLEAGAQVAVLAPTSVLAAQWHDRATSLLEPLGVSPALLTGALSARERRELLGSLESGRTRFVVGTHALIQQSVSIPELGLAIVDEQHRFGVFQRAALQARGGRPHLLAMTATPIPRSLALTLYGDLDLTELLGRPPRGPVKTELLDRAARPVVWPRVRAVAQRGQRAYVVCPRVEGEGRAVLRTAEELADGPLAGIPLGVLHGRMPDAAKAAVLQRFRDGELRVLVTTTVVEVGVDVPDATLMVVEDADRFGLAQLHQLRGRVGRSELGGACILLSEANERLALLVSSDDGFVLAEQDLRLRGPGDLVGARQSGTPAFALFRSPRFAELLAAARDAAREIVGRPDFAGEGFAVLRKAAAARLPRAGALESS